MIRIALADAFPVYRKGVAALLSETTDLTLVLEASTSKELLDGLHTTHADVVLLEAALADVDGSDMVRELRRQFGDTVRSVVVSNDITEPAVLHMLRSGVSAFLAKGSPPQQLLDAIRTVHTQGYWFNELVTANRLRSLVADGQPRPLFSNPVHLSDREREVLMLICQQYTNNEIADTLRLSASTVHGYRNSLLIKTGAKNTAGLVMYAVGAGIM